MQNYSAKDGARLSGAKFNRTKMQNAGLIARVLHSAGPLAVLKSMYPFGAPAPETVGMWLSLVEHSLGVRGVGSSNLPIPTIFRINKLDGFPSSGKL